MCVCPRIAFVVLFIKKYRTVLLNRYAIALKGERKRIAGRFSNVRANEGGESKRWIPPMYGRTKEGNQSIGYPPMYERTKEGNLRGLYRYCNNKALQKGKSKFIALMLIKVKSFDNIRNYFEFVAFSLDGESGGVEFFSSFCVTAVFLLNRQSV